MNVPTVQPPPKRGCGVKPKLSRLQEIEAWSWYQARKYLGTFKSKSREMGVPETNLKAAIARMLMRERGLR